MSYEIPADHSASAPTPKPTKLQHSAHFVLFDLDNCLCDDHHRLPLIDKTKTGNARYEAYHAAHVEDQASKEALNILMSEIVSGRVPIFITGRPDTYRSSTIAWLHTKFFSVCELAPSFFLWMRPAENHMPSGELKRWLIKDSPYQLYQFVAAYDDFEDVLHGYRDMGIPCRKLAIHHHQNNDRGDRLHIKDVTHGDWPESGFDLQRDGLINVTVPELDSPTAFEASFKVQDQLYKGKIFEDPVAFLKGSEPTAADILDEMAGTFRERNKVYGDNYKRVGEVMKAMFPDGIDLRTPEDFNTWHLFELIIVKLTRFANSGLTHHDSIHDAGVYCAMVESTLTKEAK